MVYDKIRRFQFESRGPLLEIEVGLKTDYPYTPASLRRMRLNDYYHGFCDLNFPEYHVCTIYEFMYDLPEYYGYQGTLSLISPVNTEISLLPSHRANLNVLRLFGGR